MTSVGPPEPPHLRGAVSEEWVLLLGEVRRLVPHEVVHRPSDPEASGAGEEEVPQEGEETLEVPSPAGASSE